MVELVRGKTISIGDLAAPDNAPSDMDNLLKLLDKADKLLNNPIVQQVLGIKPQQPAPAPADYQPMPALPELAIVARSQVHLRIFQTLNRFDENQLMAMLEKFGGQINGGEEIIKALKG